MGMYGKLLVLPEASLALADAAADVFGVRGRGGNESLSGLRLTSLRSPVVKERTTLTDGHEMNCIFVITTFFGTSPQTPGGSELQL